MERTRLARAGELVLGKVENEVVAAHFVHRFDDYERLESVARGLYPRLPPDGVLTEAVYVVPAWRGRSIAPRLLSATCRRLASEDVRCALAYIDVTNRSSLRAFREAGYDRTDEMRLDRYFLGTRRSRFLAADELAARLWAANVRGVGERPAVEG
jgi:RimJ/RimL family protein N-acetyltransferase